MENIKAKPHPLFYLVLLAAIGLVAGAVYAWVTQISEGLGVTGMNRPVTWGIYIINFVFFIGVSAGGIAVASLANLGGLAKYRAIGRIAEVVAIISLVLSGAAIFFDLGRPDRIFNMILYAQATSPMVWDMIILSIYFVLCAGLLWAGIKGNEKLAKTLAWISIPTFVLVHSITAWIFGLQKAQAGWHTAILAPLFIVSALVSGLGMVIGALLFTKKLWRFQNIDDTVITELGKYFKVLLPVLFYFLFSEFITIAYAAVPEHSNVLSELLSGRFAGVFWFDMILGIVIPFLLIMSPAGRSLTGVGFVSFLTVLGVLAERTNIILPSFYHHDLIATTPIYSPTWVEWVLMLGLWSGGLLLFTIVLKLLPEEKHDSLVTHATHHSNKPVLEKVTV